VERAVALLVQLADDPAGASLQTLAHQIGCSKSTVFRLVTTLEQLGVVDQDPQSQRYRLGLRLWSLSRASWSRNDLRDLAMPHLVQLRDVSEETATLSLFDRDGGVSFVVEQVESPNQIRRVYPIGQPVPILRGATSKAILAVLPPAEAELILTRNQTPYHSGPTPDELRDVRNRGYSLSMGERLRGGLAISAPILDATGRPCGSLGVSGPIDRLTADRALSFAGPLVAAARRISEGIGYAGPLLQAHTRLTAEG
jgi:DNA-binding IclR family transcriptional regulator